MRTPILVPTAALALLLLIPAPAHAGGPAFEGWAGFFGGPTFTGEDAPIVWRASGRAALGPSLGVTPLSLELGFALDGGYSSSEGPFDSRFRTRYLELGPLLRFGIAFTDQIGVYVASVFAFVHARTTTEVPILGRSTEDATGRAIRVLAGVEVALSEEVRLVIEPLGLNLYDFDGRSSDLWSVLVGAVAVF